MENGIVLECSSLAEVQEATSQLDKATVGPIQFIDNGVVKDVGNFKGIYNVSKGRFCAAVIPQYNLVQHKEYFDCFAESLTRMGLKYSMSMKQSGDRAFCDIEFKDRNIKFDKLNEEFTTGLRLINSYNKSTGVYVIPRFTRLACTNGMILTRSEKTLSIKHHSKILSEISSFVEKKISEVINKDMELQEWVSSSMKDSIEWKSACYIIAKLFNQLKHREEVLKRLGLDIISVENKKTKKKNIAYVWTKKEDKKDKLNRWDIYNAITNYLTFGEQITPHIENLFHRQAEKVLTTPLKKLPMIKPTVL